MFPQASGLVTDPSIKQPSPTKRSPVVNDAVILIKRAAINFSATAIPTAFAKLAQWAGCRFNAGRVAIFWVTRRSAM